MTVQEFLIQFSGVLTVQSRLKPTDIAGLFGWWKADAGTYEDTSLTTPASADADPVGGLWDWSGNGNHLTQSTSTKRPALKLAIQNGLPVLRFDGVDDFLAGAFGAAQSQPYTLLFAFSLRTVAAQKSVCDGKDATHRCQLITFPDASTWDFYAGGADTNAGTPDAAWHALGIRVNGAASKVRFDGGADTTVSPGTQGVSGITLGTAYDGTSAGAVDVGESLAYSGAVSDANLISLMSYLKGRWGTP